MEEERQKQVWARVRGGRMLPIEECARCAGILRYLLKRGVCRETVAWVYKRQTEQLEILRGILALEGKREPAWTMAVPQGVSNAQASAQTVELLRSLAIRYGVHSNDASYGGLFAHLSRQSWAMAGDMLRVYTYCNV